jgi:formate hydrogenlyase transcriptional activator
MVTNSDVQAQQRPAESAGERLRESEERLGLILDWAAEAIFGCDPEGQCLFCNRAAVHLLGYDDPAELIGKNMHALAHHTRADGTPYPMDECPIYTGIKKGQDVHREEDTYWRKDGSTVPVEVWSHPIIRGDKVFGAVITLIDISERKKKEEALRKGEQRWRAVFENSAIGVALSDPDDGHYLAANRAYQQMVGYTEDELRNLSFLDITHKDYRNEHLVPRAALLEERQSQFQIEKQYQRKDGRLIWASNNVSLVPGTEEVPRFVMALSEDITERKRAEEALRKSEQRWRALLEINNAIITNLTHEGLLQAVAATLRPLIAFDRVAFSLYNPKKDTFRILSKGADPMSAIRDRSEFKRGEGVSTWVFDHRQPALCRDLEKEQRYPYDRRHLAEGIYSYCVVPLITRGKSIGTLNVSSKTRNQYSEVDREFLQEIANQVALAVENMQSYEEIETLKGKLEEENVYLQDEIRTAHNFEEIVGNSTALLEVLAKVEQVAPTDSTVLIWGETGTGKELIARAIHDRSRRKDRPLVKVNCSAISAGLVESELFGHVKGAFTGALGRRIGRFELASGGTIFLDEIGELPSETQVKLLRVLQEREFEPVGSSRSVRVDVRVIAATNRNLEESVRAGNFRDDLFYRLNVFPLELPPLRDRRSDIPKLAKFFLAHYAKKLGKSIKEISPDTMDRILEYSWPGNVRELQNVIERAVILCRQPILELEPDRAAIASRGVRSNVTERTSQTEVALYPASASSPTSTLKEIERNHILAVLRQTGGVISGPKGAARILDLHPNTLRHRINKLGI